jgi:hypothetical protein
MVRSKCLNSGNATSSVAHVTAAATPRAQTDHGASEAVAEACGWIKQVKAALVSGNGAERIQDWRREEPQLQQQARAKPRRDRSAPR